MVLSKFCKQDASFSTPKICSLVVTIPYWILGVAFRQIFSQYPVKFITYKTRRNSRSKNGNWCKTWFRSITKETQPARENLSETANLDVNFFFYCLPHCQFFGVRIQAIHSKVYTLFCHTKKHTKDLVKFAPGLLQAQKNDFM